MEQRPGIIVRWPLQKVLRTPEKKEKSSFMNNNQICNFVFKVEKILKGSLNLFSSPSPSLEIQIMGGKVWLRGEYKIIA